jgi:hypothetical protein
MDRAGLVHAHVLALKGLHGVGDEQNQTRQDAECDEQRDDDGEPARTLRELAAPTHGDALDLIDPRPRPRHLGRRAALAFLCDGGGRRQRSHRVQRPRLANAHALRPTLLLLFDLGVGALATRAGRRGGANPGVAAPHKNVRSLRSDRTGRMQPLHRSTRRRIMQNVVHERIATYGPSSRHD